MVARAEFLSSARKREILGQNRSVGLTNVQWWNSIARLTELKKPRAQLKLKGGKKHKPLGHDRRL